VLDVNDNEPKFERDSYSAVTPENVAAGWSVIKVIAKDPDESLSGEVEYEIADDGDAHGKTFRSVPKTATQHYCYFRTFHDEFHHRRNKNKKAANWERKAETL